MADAKNLVKVAAGAAAALAAAMAFGVGEVSAKPARARPRGVLVPQTTNLSRTGVPLNVIIDIGFSQPVDPASIGPATFYVRALSEVANPTNYNGYTKQVFGSYAVSGSSVRFFPRLPGHLRDSDGNFFQEGTAKDNAIENAGLQAGTSYQLVFIGRPAATVIRSTAGRPLRATYFSRFSTTNSSEPDELFTTKSYSDNPPPQYSFSNPADTVPSQSTQYAIRGGTKGVPNDIGVQLYCTRVPIAPGTARIPESITLTMLERYGNPALRRPVQGSVYVEQNYETTLLLFKPKYPLSDRGLYALRVTKNVRDLTEQHDFMPNRERDRLRQIYDHLVTQRASNPPGTPASQLKDPAPALIGDWPPPEDTAARGVLKENLLALGDAHPEEFDPRVMVIFTSRDEPVSNAQLRIEFNKSENLLDASLSTGEWDQTVPGAASAIFTASAGTGVNGDFSPSSNVTLPSASLPGPVFNFRAVNIPAGVTVRLTGAQPLTIRAINFTLNGTIDASGFDGLRGTTVSNITVAAGTAPAAGGQGGPGGGRGASGQPSHQLGILADWWLGGGGTGQPGTYGPWRSPSGSAGVDTDGGNPTTVGGQGGQGGSAATGSNASYTYSYGYAGGGGGGGAAAAGQNGADARWTGTPYSAWNGRGGAGGAAAVVTDLQPMFGGAGGGASGIGGFTPEYSNYTPITQGWVSGGASGGGGGGALTIQTAKSLTIGTTGQLRARGGVGGAGHSPYGSYGETGGAGGGSGGSLLLRTTGTFNIANPSGSLVVSGGTGGAQASYSGAGGSGSVGFIRAEDPTGAASVNLPGLSGNPIYSSKGSFDPIGGGLPSYVYSKWVDLGVDDPRMLPWAKAEVTTNPTSNDGILIQAQMTREHPVLFGSPDVSQVDSLQNSKNVDITSPWVGVKVHDRTGIAGGAFGPIPGYDIGIDGTEFSGFDVAALNGHGFRFIRFRIFFQLDQTQQFSDPLPHVDYIITRYQFNL